MLTKEDIGATQLKTERDDLVRRARMRAISEWTGFAVSKVVGVGALTIGLLELANPSFHPVTQVPPESLLTGGLALLFGEQIIRAIAHLHRISGK
jgi:hypothetical protein